ARPTPRRRGWTRSRASTATTRCGAPRAPDPSGEGLQQGVRGGEGIAATVDDARGELVEQPARAEIAHPRTNLGEREGRDLVPGPGRAPAPQLSARGEPVEVLPDRLDDVVDAGPVHRGGAHHPSSPAVGRHALTHP